MNQSSDVSQKIPHQHNNDPLLLLHHPPPFLQLYFQRTLPLSYILKSRDQSGKGITTIPVKVNTAASNCKAIQTLHLSTLFDIHGVSNQKSNFFISFLRPSFSLVFVLSLSVHRHLLFFLIFWS